VNLPGRDFDCGLRCTFLRYVREDVHGRHYQSRSLRLAAHSRLKFTQRRHEIAIVTARATKL
jgi:hypothetical protein